jgi:hypothetical protein
MFVKNLVLEITRRCNATCKHCVRGDQQNITIREEYLDCLAESLSGIESLTISGGEPSLAVNQIAYFLEKLQELNTPITYQLYTATNGLENTSKLVDLMRPWKDKVPKMQISLSNTAMHPEVPSNNLEIIRSCGFGFIGPREDGLDNRNVIMEGRALAYVDEVLHAKSAYTNFPIEISGNTIRGICYVNSLGYVIDGSAYSYDTQDSGVATLGHIFEVLNRSKTNG